jgi:ketosteroid isomerase-like protein
MTDDVEFQVPGKMPFGKAEFEAMSSAGPGSARPSIDAQQTILELQVLGDFAYMRSALKVRVTPPGGKSTERTGTTLTIFRKVSGHWLLFRDANLLTAV